MPVPTVSRRQVVAGTAAGAALAVSGLRAPAVAATTEIVHWSWLQASDGEVWTRVIDAYNAAHKDKGTRIRMELVPEEQYRTKLLAAAASGSAPDFGWGTAGKDAELAKNGVTVPLDALAKQAGLDVADFSANSLVASKYPKIGADLQMVPMDMMCLC